MTLTAMEKPCTVLSVSNVVPAHAVTIERTKDIVGALAGRESRGRWDAMVDACGIATRYSVRPVEEIAQRSSIGQRSEDYEREVIDLAGRAAFEALCLARVEPREIGTVISVSCTGYMLPSLDCHLIGRLKLSRRVRRIPITELGCSAGVGALAIAKRASSSSTGLTLLVSAEPCSLCLRVDAPAPSDLLGAVLFGDGAAAAVIAADDRAGPAVLAESSELWPELSDQLGMRLDDGGFRFVLSPRLPALVRDCVCSAVDSFLSPLGLTTADVAFWIVHPGGPRILRAVRDALKLDDAAMRASWNVWNRCGNVSSATVFFILREIARVSPPAPGDLGVMLAFGPGITCEMALLRADGWLTQTRYS